MTLFILGYCTAIATIVAVAALRLALKGLHGENSIETMRETVVIHKQPGGPDAA